MIKTLNNLHFYYQDVLANRVSVLGHNLENKWATGIDSLIDMSEVTENTEQMISNYISYLLFTCVDTR